MKKSKVETLSQLQKAVVACDPGAVEAILSEHINAQMKNGMTALHLAAAVFSRRCRCYKSCADAEKVISLLLRYGADPTIRDLDSRIPNELSGGQSCQALREATLKAANQQVFAKEPGSRIPRGQW